MFAAGGAVVAVTLPAFSIVGALGIVGSKALSMGVEWVMGGDVELSWGALLAELGFAVVGNWMAALAGVFTEVRIMRLLRQLNAVDRKRVVARVLAGLGKQGGSSAGSALNGTVRARYGSAVRRSVPY